ncbi:MAG: hypothetical protein H6R26_1833, partial [Proteobacteria bacterium]|nr:hypothetical protein [Pseudomonadota bacterium]
MTAFYQTLDNLFNQYRQLIGQMQSVLEQE